MLTVANRISTRENNFGIVRFTAASLVVYSHSYPLSGHIVDEPLARISGILDLATAAVIAFFVVSGFLIAKSASQSPLSRFVQARFLRIWPALLATALLSALVLGPIATTLPLRQYFSAKDTWLYAVAIPLLDFWRFLPETFVTNPVPLAVNGSLWTLQVEIWLYMIMTCLVLTAIKWRRAAFNCFAVIAFISYKFFPEQILGWIPRHDEYMTPGLVGCFILGGLLFFNAKYVPLNFYLGCVAVLAAIVGMSTSWFSILFYVAFAYWIVLLSLHPTLYISSWNSRVDYSYGIYVFAFPIQQTIVFFFKPIGPLALFAVAYPLSVALAAILWSFVESKALALKPSALLREAPPVT